MKKYLVFILCAVFAFSMLVGCTPATTTTQSSTTSSQSGETTTETSAEEIVTIRLGTFNSRIGFTTWYMMENGLDEENGFKLDVVTSTAGGSVLNEAIGAGLLDATLMGSPAGVYTASVYGCKIIAELSEGNGGLNLFGRADSEEAQIVGANPDYPDVRGSAETLQGKSIMYPVGSMAQLGVAAYLDVFDLTLDDVDSVNISYAPGYQALQAGEGDIVALFSPLNYQALTDGYVKLMSLDQLNIPVRDMLMVTPKTYNDPVMMGAVEKYLTLLFELNDKFQDEEEQLKYLVDFHAYHGTTIADPSLLSIEVEDMYLLSSEQALTQLDTMGQACLDIAKFYLEIGIVEEGAVIATEESIDKSIVQKILG